MTTESKGAILIVEDDHDIRETFREVLELEGYRVLTAANGREALEETSPGEAVCLILLDLMMPVMNGWEFLETRSGNPALAQAPVVVITAAGTRPDKVPQATQIIKKPVEIDALIDVVSRYCTR